MWSDCTIYMPFNKKKNKMRTTNCIKNVKIKDLALLDKGIFQSLFCFHNAIFQNIVYSFLISLLTFTLNAQTETIPVGSYIINMGVTPQTIGNGLKPYGMLYDLIKNHKVSVLWAINPAKSKDGVDFVHNGVSYRGGPFIIPADFRTPDVNARITHWQSQGVRGETTVSEINVPVYRTLSNVPRWTLDKRNGKLALPYFANAGIPPSAHGGTSDSGWKDPSELDCCDDLFILPHADPVWSTHQRLYFWNQECRGGIWNGCHSGSALENMLNPSNRSQQTNFLSTKDPAFTGSSGSYSNSNSLILWGSHSGGSPPYIHRLPADPVAQYIGNTDAAHTNGAEQIFIPRQSTGTIARWNPGANIIAYDPTHSDVPSLQSDLRNAASVIIYGRGFDDPTRGFVMHNAGHSMNKSTQPANIAGQRAFFNFSWLVAQDKAENLFIESGGGDISYSGDGRTYTFELPGGNVSDFNIEWSSTCGGSFSPDANTQTLTFTPPPSTDISGCIITVSITDDCGRTTSTSLRTAVLCDYNVSHSVVNPSCLGGSDGLINFTLSGESVFGTNDYNWEKDGTSVTGSGTGLEIAGLNAGTYHVTVTSFTGCTATFSALLRAPNAIEITSNIRNYTCFGESGLINISVTGGTIPYSYLWEGGVTTRNRENLTAGTYTLTVTDSKGCTQTSVSEIMGQTSAFTVSHEKTDITCFGLTNGTANISLSGGSPSFNFLWSDGNSSQNRTGLSTGSYIVTVTDVQGCITSTNFTISQPPQLSVQVAIGNPSCPTSGQPPSAGDGTIMLTVSGGVQPYSYVWNDAVTTKDRSGLSEGNYTVTVTDSNGCQTERSMTLLPASSMPGAPVSIIK